MAAAVVVAVVVMVVVNLRIGVEAAVGRPQEGGVLSGRIQPAE